LSARQGMATPINPNELFQNPLTLDPEIVEVLKKNNLHCRFVNYKKLAANDGIDEHYFTPLRRSQLKEMGYAKMDTHSFLQGNDVEGYFRRGDLILCVRPVEINEKHKAYLKQENERLSTKKANRKHASAISEMLRDRGMSNEHSQVTSGYEDEGDEDAE